MEPRAACITILIGAHERWNMQFTSLTRKFGSLFLAMQLRPSRIKNVLNILRGNHLYNHFANDNYVPGFDPLQFVTGLILQDTDESKT